MTGLPAFVATSWEKAKQVIESNGVVRHPGLTFTAVKSPAQPKLYTVINNCCECRQYENFKICHHTIAEAADSGKLMMLVSMYKPPTMDILYKNKAGPSTSGQKNGKKRKRVPLSKKVVFDRSQFRDQFVYDNGNNERDENVFEITFVDTTQTFVC